MQLVKAEKPVTPTVVPWRDKTTRQKLWAILPWVVFGVACVLFVLGLIVGYVDGLFDDMSGELILAKLLSEGKGFIITNQWYYSTEIRFLNTQLIFTPLFWLFKSWVAVRIVGTIILNGLMLLAFWFLMASLQRKPLFPWLAALLLLPLSVAQIASVNYGTFYIPHIAISFTVLGLLFYALRADTNKKRFWWLVGGAGVLSFLAAIGGFRQVVILSIPLFSAAVIFWLLNRQNERKDAAIKLLVGSSIALAAAVVGLLINILILQNCFSFDNWGTKIGWTDLLVWKIENFINIILAAFGWVESDTLYSAATFYNLTAGIIGVLFIVAVVDIIKHRDRYAESIVVLTLFTLCGLVAFIGIWLTTTMDIDRRHIFPITVFCLPLIAFYLTQNWQWQVVGKKLKMYLKPVFGVAVLVLALFSAVLVNCQYYYAGVQPWHDTTKNTSLVTIADRLLSAGYLQGYCMSEYWGEASGSVLTELTDGRIETWNLLYWHDTQSLNDIYPFLQITSHMTEHPTGKVFIMIGCERFDDPLPQKLAAAGGYVFYTDQNYIVYTYDSVDELWAIVG